MANLGMCANMFINHIYYWGDQHLTETVGPERAYRMNALRTAKREGAQFSMHSDEMVTPLGGLMLMWCAVNRVTASGKVLGPEERISVYDALKAVTIDAAYQLKMDHEVGTIECGKWADFAVLEKDPFAVEPMELKDIPVWGTILGGKLFPAAGD
jgi:predicted amidohydrolase YtcJ